MVTLTTKRDHGNSCHKGNHMSENIKPEDLIEKKDVTSTSPEEKTVEQDPLKAELERVQKTGKTEAEKASFSLKKNAERARELGIDVEDILGIKKSETILSEDDNAPVTVGMLKKIQQDTAAKTALQLADDITSESERELTKYHLQNSIKSTGNPQDDLRMARALTNSARNSQVLEEITRKAEIKNHSNGSGAPARDTEVQGELTPVEKEFQRAFKMTKEQIIKARVK